MATLVFATNNPNKIREIQAQLGDQYNFQSLADIGCLEDIAETAPTLEGNAQLKADYVFQKYGLNCFSEDTGLEVTALDGAPGVITARYAGAARDPAANMNKVLEELADQTDRSARFRTVLCLIQDGKEHYFEGISAGHIAHQKTGEGGFGYDPIFVPEGEDRSFAQMSGAEKIQFSHRARAMTKLVKFLKTSKT